MTTTDIHATEADSAHGSHAAHEEHKHHVCSSGTFMKVLLAPLFLTFVTVWIAQFDFGSANMLVAMGVASIKAALVMAIFMHLRWDTTTNNIFFLSSFFFLALLFLFTFADWFGRSALEPKNAEPAPLERITEYNKGREKEMFDRLEKVRTTK